MDHCQNRKFSTSLKFSEQALCHPSHSGGRLCQKTFAASTRYCWRSVACLDSGKSLFTFGSAYHFKVLSYHVFDWQGKLGVAEGRRLLPRAHPIWAAVGVTTSPSTTAGGTSSALRGFRECWRSSTRPILRPWTGFITWNQAELRVWAAMGMSQWIRGRLLREDCICEWIQLCVCARAK